MQLGERLTFLGQIPRGNDFESLHPGGRKAGGAAKVHVPDDTALAYRSSEGLVIVTRLLPQRNLQHRRIRPGSLRRGAGGGYYRRFASP